MGAGGKTRTARTTTETKEEKEDGASKRRTRRTILARPAETTTSRQGRNLESDGTKNAKEAEPEGRKESSNAASGVHGPRGGHAARRGGRVAIVDKQKRTRVNQDGGRYEQKRRTPIADRSAKESQRPASATAKQIGRRRQGTKRSNGE